MKTPLVLLLVLFSGSLAFGAIEFSEDQVASSGEVPAVVDSTEIAAVSGAAEPLGQMTTGSGDSVAPQLVAAATGIVPAAGASSSAAGGSTGAGGVGGGGGVQPSAEDDTAEISVAQSAGADLADQEGLATPEPSAIVVWAVLAIFGCVAVNWRRTRIAAH